MRKSSSGEFARLTSFGEAAKRLARLRVVVGEENLPLAKSLLRVNAIAIRAPFDLPWANNAAVDGYAFSFAAARKARLRLGGELAIGTPPPRVAADRAWSVATGSPVPSPLDTVVMEEHCRVESDGYLRLPSTYAQGSNLRKRGEDLKRGRVAIAAGAVLRPQELAMAAALGVATVTVKKPLKLGVASSGNELQRRRTTLKLGKLYDANRPSLMALASLARLKVKDYGIVGDNKKAVSGLLRLAAAECDAVAISGGSSSDRQDVVAAAIAELGVFHFKKCAVKPGRPFSLAEIDGTPIFNLPGNVVAANVIFMMMVKPTLARLGGAAATRIPRFAVAAAFSAAKKSGRREWLRGRLRHDRNGKAAVTKAPSGAGILSSLTTADGLIELGEDITHVRHGQMVDFIPFSSMW